MQVTILPDAAACGLAAAESAVAALQQALARQPSARLVMASAASQFALVEALAAAEIDWARVTLFHLDEYLGLTAEHPASFRRFLQDRFLSRLRVQPAAFWGVQGEAADAAAECARLGALLAAAPVDLACIGIGENGHIAFNDPPADFTTPAAYHVVALDEACRRQQWGEGWFASLEAVPREAISMTCPQILAARTIVCTVPDSRKAAAVQQALEGPVTPAVPASILQRHTDCRLYLDRASAALLTETHLG